MKLVVVSEVSAADIAIIVWMWRCEEDRFIWRGRHPTMDAWQQHNTHLRFTSHAERVVLCRLGFNAFYTQAICVPPYVRSSAALSLICNSFMGNSPSRTGQWNS